MTLGCNVPGAAYAFSTNKLPVDTGCRIAIGITGLTSEIVLGGVKTKFVVGGGATGPGATQPESVRAIKARLIYATDRIFLSNTTF